MSAMNNTAISITATADGQWLLSIDYVFCSISKSVREIHASRDEAIRARELYVRAWFS